METAAIGKSFKNVIKNVTEVLQPKHSFTVRTNEKNRDKFIRLINKYPPKLIVIDDKVQRDDMLVQLIY